MKLLDSRIEREIRDNFIKNSSLIMDNENILFFLNEKFKSISSVYVLSHTVEQAEDIYTLLVNGEAIIDFEISRLDNSIYNVSMEKVIDYSREIKGKLPKIKPMIALELSKAIR